MILSRLRINNHLLKLDGRVQKHSDSIGILQVGMSNLAFLMTDVGSVKAQVAELKLKIAENEARRVLQKSWLAALWAVLGASLALIVKSVLPLLLK